MKETINRRRFLKGSAAVTMSGFLAGSICNQVKSADLKKDSKAKLKKAIVFSMIQEKISVEDKFKLLADLGFHGVEMPTTHDQKEVETAARAAEKTGIRIHSVMNMGHWKFPLSSANPEVIKKSVDFMRVSLENANFWGADTVLLVPAVVRPAIRYKDAYQRSQKVIREQILPMARKLKVVVAIENVWNRFLLSPLEFARYIDELNDPYLQAYFDVGNIVYIGYPHDWMLTLGSRIKKMHIKDFNRKEHKFVMIRDGEVKWPVVRKTMDEIGYTGYLTVEAGRVERDTLKEISKRLDLIIEGK